MEESDVAVGDRVREDKASRRRRRGRSFARLWSIYWVLFVLASVGLVALVLDADVTYAFVVATPGMFELVSRFPSTRGAVGVWSAAVGFSAGCWAAGLAVEHWLGWGWVDRWVGVWGIVIVGAIAAAALALRAFGRRPIERE